MNASFLAVPYRDIGDVAFAVWELEMSRYPTSPLIPVARDLYEITKGHTALALAHLKRESEFETQRSLLSFDDHNCFNLRPNDQFPTPAGATGVKANYLTFDSYQACARQWLWRITSPDYYRLLDDGTKVRYMPTMTLMPYLATYAPVGDKHPNTGDANETYATDVVKMLTRFLKEEQALAVATPQTQESTPMAKYKVYLTDTETIDVESQVPIRAALISKRQTNQRPGGVNPMDNWIQHENGNPEHEADDERRYFHQGAEGRQASYHFVGDDTEIIQLVPIREWTWQASDNLGRGNTRSISGSIAQGAKNFLKARKAMAFFAGNLMAHPKVDVPRANVIQHYDCAPNRKNCPQWIRDGGKWPEHKADIQRAYDAARQGGGEPVPAPVTYPKPIQIAKLDIAQGIAPTMVTLDDGTECIWVGDRVRAIRDTRRRQWAGEKAPDIGPVIPKGTEFDVDWLLKNAEGWWFYTPYDTRVKADDCERISDAKAAA